MNHQIGCFSTQVLWVRMSKKFLMRIVHAGETYSLKEPEDGSKSSHSFRWTFDFNKI